MPEHIPLLINEPPLIILTANAPWTRAIPANRRLSFLTFSCYRRLAYLDPAAPELLESALERTRRRYCFVVGGYVVMPEHVHLLVSEPRRGTLARVVQALKLSVSLRRRSIYRITSDRAVSPWMLASK
jgi:REP element-mobilizing transposase RayT